MGNTLEGNVEDRFKYDLPRDLLIPGALLRRNLDAIRQTPERFGRVSEYAVLGMVEGIKLAAYGFFAYAAIEILVNG